MQFSRTVLNNNYSGGSPMFDINKPNNVNSFFKNCGFKYGDNTEIDLSTEMPENAVNNLKFLKWGYETRYNSDYLKIPFPYIYRSHPPGTQGMEFSWTNFAGIVPGSANRWVMPNSPCLPTFFIPLKNRGFIFITYNLLSTNSVEGPNITPKLYSYNYLPGWDKTNTKTGADILPIYFCMCGIFNNMTNTYDYITSYSLGNQNSGTYCCSQDFNELGSDYISLIYAPTGFGRKICDADENKTDIKANCVTLLKTPFGSGFHDNLYTAITIPEEGKQSWYSTEYFQDNRPYKTTGLENKFFSINGRNFYGLVYNLVVELPS